MRKIASILIVFILMWFHVGTPPAEAFTGISSVLGFIADVDLGKMEITIDNDTVEINPKIEIKSTLGRRIYIHDLRVGMFVNASVIPYGRNWKASKLKLIDKNKLKSITSYVKKFENSVLTLGNGLDFLVPKSPKLVGFDEFEKDIVLRIDGYATGNKMNIWRFVAPYTDKNADYTFCGRLTSLSEDKLVIDSKIVMHFDDLVLWDELGWEIPEAKPRLGENLRMTCGLDSNLLHVKKCELFDTIRIQMFFDRKDVLINKTPVILDMPITNVNNVISIPISSIFEYCNLKLKVENNIMSTVYDGIFLEYNMKTGDIFVDSVLIDNIGTGHIKNINSKYVVPLPVFGFLFSKNNSSNANLVSIKDFIISNKH